jgi:hypothetical protein
MPQKNSPLTDVSTRSANRCRDHDTMELLAAASEAGIACVGLLGDLQTKDNQAAS